MENEPKSFGEIYASLSEEKRQMMLSAIMKSGIFKDITKDDILPNQATLDAIKKEEDKFLASQGFIIESRAIIYDPETFSLKSTIKGSYEQEEEEEKGKDPSGS